MGKVHATRFPFNRNGSVHMGGDTVAPTQRPSGRYCRSPEGFEVVRHPVNLGEGVQARDRQVFMAFPFF
jgi:hypothetical protein